MADLRRIRFTPITDINTRVYVAAMADMLGTFKITKNPIKDTYTCWGAYFGMYTSDPRIIQFINNSFNITRDLKSYPGKEPKFWMRAGPENKKLISRWQASGALLDHILEIVIEHGLLQVEISKVVKRMRYLLTDGKLTHKISKELASQRNKVYEEFVSLEKEITEKSRTYVEK